MKNVPPLRDSHPQLPTKLTQLLTAANKNIVDSISGLQAEIRTLKDKVAERDATIEELQVEVRQLRLQNDALEQYGRSSSLRITGISEDQEDTAKAVMDLTNKVLDTPFQEQDIDVSHRLKKPRNCPRGGTKTHHSQVHDKNGPVQSDIQKKNL